VRPTRFDDVLRWLTPDELSKMGEDRAAIARGHATQGAAARGGQAHLAVYLERLDRTLATQPFCWAQQRASPISPRTTRLVPREARPGALAPFPALGAWMARIAAIPDATVTPITSDDALLASRESTRSTAPTSPSRPGRLTLGQRVVVRAADYGRDPVEGDLVLSTGSRWLSGARTRAPAPSSPLSPHRLRDRGAARRVARRSLTYAVEAAADGASFVDVLMMPTEFRPGPR